MTQEDPGRPALAAVLEMTDSLKATAREVGLLRASVRTSRRIIAGLVMSIILDVTLTVFLAIVAVDQHTATNEIHSAQLAACASTNSTRASGKALWDSFLAILLTPPAAGPEPKPAQVAADHKIAAQFEKQVARVYMPVDCARAYP